VATDYKASDVESEWAPGSVIENELPTYRAISVRAVLSVLCGAIALFSLAHPFFYLFAILAVLLGFTADRNIQRYPDMLTGKGLAQAGVAMGLIFGLGVFTITTVQTLVRVRNASSFAEYYAGVVQKGTLADLIWLELPPAQRKGISAEEAMEKLKGTRQKDPTVYEARTGSFRALKKRMDSSRDQEIKFAKIEKEGEEGLVAVALALFEVHGSPTKDFPAEHEHVLAIMKGTKEGSKGYEWWVEELRYPYKPASEVIPEKAVDDGHGHSQH
jgi:hypothetical protein